MAIVYALDHAIWRLSHNRSCDELISRLAGIQHGVVARWQLRAMGMSDSAIDWRVRTARVQFLHPGVYSVGPPRPGSEPALMATLLAMPRGSLASHRSAGSMQKLHTWTGLPEVTTPTQRRCRHGSWITHTAPIPSDERLVLSGIPLTKPSRTLFDLAAVLDEPQLRRALNEAAYLRLPLSPSLPELIERHPRRHGVATLRKVLGEGRVGLERVESDFELEFLEWLKERGFPPAVHQHPVTVGNDRYRLDLAWPDRMVAVELDTPAGHDHPEAIERDKRRDRRLRSIGWTVLRITAHAFELERGEVEADLRAALALPAVT